MSITILHPGLLTTVQDLGRHGYQKYGIIVSGAMDAYALRTANLLVGNEEGVAVLELTLQGPTLQLTAGTLLALTGGDLSPALDGVSLPMWRPVYITKDCKLTFSTPKAGCRAYLAVAGGYDLPKVMGSQSTYLRAGLGGYQGRALQKGDVLELKAAAHKSCPPSLLTKKTVNSCFVAAAWYAGHSHITTVGAPVVIRVLPGRQQSLFTKESKQEFFQAEYKITANSDRMGYRLSGPALQLKKHVDMISEATALGTVQVPSDGQPILLLADRQTTGGYPKIAQIIQVDLALVAQLKPGTAIKFQEVSQETAEELYINREEELLAIKQALSLKIPASAK